MSGHEAVNGGTAGTAAGLGGGTRAEVLERMLATLADRLPALTVRGTADPAVALLDAWATVADVVNFYQERIAGEGFLRTATERRSVLELARAVGYELRPGVAAAVHLSFTVEDAPGAPGRVVVPAGTQVQSVPGQGEVPRTFETDREIVAVAGRNSMELRLWRAQRITPGGTSLRLAGVETGLRPGDGLLVRSTAEGGPWWFRVLRTVRPEPADATGRPPTTVVGWDGGLGDLGMDGDAVEVHAFRLRAAIFGHNAPDWRIMTKDVRERYAATGGPGTFDGSRFDADLFDSAGSPGDWPGFALPDGTGDGPVIELDGAHPAILPGSWLLLRSPGTSDGLYRVEAAAPSAAADFGITATTTRLRLRGDGRLSRFGRRTTAVLAQSERLPLAGEPVTEPVTGPRLLLDRPVELEPGSLVVVTGTALDGLPVAEPAHVTTAREEDTGGTRVTLSAPLRQPLDPPSVRLLGNVVTATAGQSVEEVLGSGDGAAAHQRFPLPHGHLTHTAAPVPGGARDSLEVRVDGVAWTPAASLFSLGPHDRSYVVRIGDDDVATVIFGDGERGARLPSGRENVRARYRAGPGTEGDVRAGAVSLLMTRPLGVRDVGNPLPASGGAEPERIEDARLNAPLAVRTLGRVVSLTDHEDFARTFAGIAKARAVVLRAGGAPFVHVTVAGPGGGEVPELTLATLRGAFDAAGRPAGRLDLACHRRMSFAVGVAVLVEPDGQRDVVFRSVADAVRATYSFERRDLAQPVTAAEVITVVQRVPGVAAAVLTALHLSGAGPFDTARFDAARFDAAEVADVLPARRAGFVSAPGTPGRSTAPAELLLVDPAQITLTEMTP
ncbi:putative baseplate assembly protein [Microbispora sp. NPDC049125]|uniref:putative baseplate assembly protein n=1 Tax=Microbispora sp. NPDC049125 TaxID=3154929 RepID=UPI003466D8B3